MKTVWIYVDTKKQLGDRDHLKVFANSDLADDWFVVNDPEGVVFEYEVIGVDETGSGLFVATCRPLTKHRTGLLDRRSGAKIYVSPLPHRASSASICSLWYRLSCRDQ